MRMKDSLTAVLKDRKGKRDHSSFLRLAKIQFYKTHVLPTLTKLEPRDKSSSTIENDVARDDATDEILSTLSMFQMQEFLRREEAYGTSIYEFCEDEGIDISIRAYSPVNSPDDYSSLSKGEGLTSFCLLYTSIL
jgi:hypothetical protein